MIENPNVPVVHNAAAREGELYAMFLDMAMTGKNAHEAIVTTTLTLSTYYRWKREHSTWIVSIQDRALDDAAEMQRDHQRQLVIMREDVQVRVTKLLVAAATDAVRAVITISKDGDHPREQLAAARTIREWLKEGYAVQVAPEEVAAALQPQDLPYNPYEEILTKATVSTLGRGKVTLTVEPEDLIDVVPVPVGPSTDP